MTQIPSYHESRPFEDLGELIYYVEYGDPSSELERHLFIACSTSLPQLPKPAQPPKPSKPRKPTLTSIAKDARKAGIDPARIEIKPDGSYVVDIGKGEQQQPNAVDQWIAKHADKTQRH